MSKELVLGLAGIFFGAGGIVLYVLGWIKNRRQLKAVVRGVDADSFKTYAEAQGLITDSTGRALELVDRLSKDVDISRQEIGKLITINREQQVLLENNKSLLEITNTVLGKTQALLEKSKLNNEVEVAELSTKVVELSNKIIQLGGQYKESEKKYKESEALLDIKKQHCIEIQNQMKVLQGELNKIKK